MTDASGRTIALCSIALCSIEGCERAHCARGWCSLHWSRWSRFGDVNHVPTRSLPFVDRFWAKVDRSGDCWVWTAYRNRNGYGQFWFNRSLHLAHRVSWILTNGSIPDGLCVLHQCDNPPCVNPAHLWVGTQVENIADRDAKGRQNHAAKTHCANGHEFTPENIYWRTAPSGNPARACVECRRIVSHRRSKKGTA